MAGVIAAARLLSSAVERRPNAVCGKGFGELESYVSGRSCRGGLLRRCHFVTPPRLHRWRRQRVPARASWHGLAPLGTRLSPPGGGVAEWRSGRNGSRGGPTTSNLPPPRPNQP